MIVTTTVRERKRLSLDEANQEPLPPPPPTERERLVAELRAQGMACAAVDKALGGYQTAGRPARRSDGGVEPNISREAGEPSKLNKAIAGLWISSASEAMRDVRLRSGPSPALPC